MQKESPVTVPTTWTEKDAEVVAQHEIDVLNGIEKETKTK